MLFNNTRTTIMKTKTNTEEPINTEVIPVYSIPGGLSREEFYGFLDAIQAGQVQPDNVATLHTYAEESE